jgi:hypothetical protein
VYSRELIKGKSTTMKKLIYSIILITVGVTLSGCTIFSSKHTKTNNFIIKGTVIDANTKDPILGASVRVQNTKLGAMTNPDGRFEIFRIEPGTYTLEISGVGYNTGVMEVTVPLSSELIISLNLKIINPDRVISVMEYPLGYINSNYKQSLKTFDIDCQPEIGTFVFPSFTPNYALTLKDVKTRDTVHWYYELEYSITMENESRFKNDPDWKMNQKYKYGNPIEHHTAYLPDSAAKTLIELWTEVLKDTKYINKDKCGFDSTTGIITVCCDGTNYDFFVKPTNFKETWSPDSGVAKAMVDLTDLLVKYVQSDSKKRDHIWKKAQMKIEEINVLLRQT